MRALDWCKLLMHALHESVPVQARWMSEEEAKFVPPDLVNHYGSLSMDLDLNDLMARPALASLQCSPFVWPTCVHLPHMHDALAVMLPHSSVQSVQVD